MATEPVNPFADLCRLLSRPLPPMARTLAPDLAAALPALVLWLRVTQARLEVLERQAANAQTWREPPGTRHGGT